MKKSDVLFPLLNVKNFTLSLLLLLELAMDFKYKEGTFSSLMNNFGEKIILFSI